MIPKRIIPVSYTHLADAHFDDPLTVSAGGGKFGDALGDIGEKIILHQ